MNINIKFAYGDDPLAYPHRPFTLKDHQAHLIPQNGDQVRHDMTTKVVRGRIFEYGIEEMTVTLICGN